MKIKLIEISKIIPYFNNPRDNSDAVEPVIESIKRYGFIKPIVVDKNNVIIAGHTRYLAAVRIGMKKIPIVVSELDEEQVKVFRIADNKLAENSVFDENLLIDELKKLKVPEEMQSFFFEDLTQMLNFDYGAIQGNMPISNEFNPYENDDDIIDEEQETNDGFVENQDSEDEETSDGIESDRYEFQEEESNDLYKPKVVNGKRVMKVICPYCENIEIITLD